MTNSHTLTGLLLTAAGVLSGGLASAEEPAFMSAAWGAAACDAWNKDATLTTELVTSKWVTNDEGRGHKVLQMYRSDCGDEASVELRIALKDGKAQCIYGGAIETQKLDGDTDYLMHATTQRWKEMGAGEYGPMRAMMFGRLHFSGPMGEAMGNMGPFGGFLKLAGAVPGSATCP